MRSRGITPSTIVQAERQGPSMMTDSPDFCSDWSLSRYGPIWPPGSDVMRIDADTGRLYAAITVAASTTLDTRTNSPPKLPSLKRLIAFVDAAKPCNIDMNSQ